MIIFSKVAFSAQAAITQRIMSSFFYSTHFPLLSNAQQCTVASSTIASSIWLLTHLLLRSLAIETGIVHYISDVSLPGAYPRMCT